MFPAERVVLGVHLVGEWNLFPVICGEEPDLREREGGCEGALGGLGGKTTYLGKHPSESSGCVCASRKSENADFVAELV